MKSKKFTAAEKHFDKKRIKIQRELNEYKKRIDDTESRNYQLKSEKEKLETENHQLREWVERLWNIQISRR